MSLKQLWDTLADVSLAQWLIAALVLFVSHAVAYFVFIRWVMRRSWKLHQNLKRPIVLLRPTNPAGDTIPGGDLSSELGLLRRNGFLNVAEGIADFRTFNPSDDHCIVVLGYKSGMAGLQDILSRLKSHHVPLIVYTYGNNAVVGSEKDLLATYPYMVYANFPLTLLGQVFSTVASYPYD